MKRAVHCEELSHTDQAIGIHSRQLHASAEMAGTYSGVLAERAAKGALVTDEAELEAEEQPDMGSLTGWQALADQVGPLAPVMVV